MHVRAIISCFLLFLVTVGYAQDSLILKNGLRIPYFQLREYADTIEIIHPDRSFSYYLPEAILGYSESMKAKSFFLKPNPELNDGHSYVFVERLASGKLSLFEKTKGQDAIYIEKNGRFEKIFDPIERGSDKEARLETLVSLVEDDTESLDYIRSSVFEFKFKELTLVVEAYNRRNFEEKIAKKRDVRGKVYLYRTKFQKTKEGIKVKHYEGISDLYIEDFIVLDLPVEYPSKLVLSDDYLRTEVLVTGDFEDQFFEVLYDKRTNEFILDPKNGTELYMEFSRIRDVINDRKTD